MASGVRLLLAESGASKTAWAWLTETESCVLPATSGINPNVQPWAAIERLLATEAPAQIPTHVRFYGAALSEEDYRSAMQRLLKVRYPGASVSVAHDLLGACRAVAGDRPCLVGILGTGSSACRYDGTRVVELRGGHGYLFGDEGSGAHLGKSLVTAGLLHQLDPAIKTQLEDFVGMDLVAFRNAVYQDEHPNQRLARLSRFVETHRAKLKGILYASFTVFLKLHVQPLWMQQQGDWHAVGSIASVFETELREACRQAKMPEPASIVRHPLAQLMAYHAAQLPDLVAHGR